MRAYSLIGVDGNAFAIMGYTQRAMRRAGMDDKIEQMLTDAKSGDYSHLICVCADWIDKVNEKLGLTEEDEW